jgi:hypothetical protein
MATQDESLTGINKNDNPIVYLQYWNNAMKFNLSMFLINNPASEEMRDSIESIQSNYLEQLKLLQGDNNEYHIKVIKNKNWNAELLLGSLSLYVQMYDALIHENKNSLNINVWHLLNEAFSYLILSEICNEFKYDITSISRVENRNNCRVRSDNVRHLRNAIAHGYLTVNGTSVTFWDQQLVWDEISKSNIWTPTWNKIEIKNNQIVNFLLSVCNLAEKVFHNRHILITYKEIIPN